MSQVGVDLFPQTPEPFISGIRTHGTQARQVRQFAPVMHQRGIIGADTFAVETLDGVVQWSRIARREHRLF